MNDRKTLLSTAGFVACAFAVIAGNEWREATQSTGARSASISTKLLASKLPAPDLSETEYFHELSRLLKREYVEPIGKDEKLAYGAIRGMVQSLRDYRARFMDPAEFKAYKNSRLGKFEGIGVDLYLQPTRSGAPVRQDQVEDDAASDSQFTGRLDIPRVVVASVVPNGPAAKAGVKPGDWVDSIDGLWVISADEILAFRELQRKAGRKEVPAKEVTDRAKVLRQKWQKSLIPFKAIEKLMLGESGKVEVTWNRAGQKVSTTISKAPSTLPELAMNGARITRLHFVPGAAAQLKSAVQGKATVTIDLRNNTAGTFDAMLECLASLGPKGDYGYVSSMRPQKARRLTLATGVARGPKLNLIVDGSTRGPAEIFALALKSRGLATIVGTPGGDTGLIETVTLPDGSGYTLVTGVFRTTAPKVNAVRPPEKRPRVVRTQETGGDVA